MKSAEQFQADALRGEIQVLLPQLTDTQLKFLHRIHDNAPWKGLQNCPDNQLAATYELIQRTIHG